MCSLFKKDTKQHLAVRKEKKINKLIVHDIILNKNNVPVIIIQITGTSVVYDLPVWEIYHDIKTYNMLDHGTQKKIKSYLRHRYHITKIDYNVGLPLCIEMLNTATGISIRRSVAEVCKDIEINDFDPASAFLLAELKSNNMHNAHM